MVRRTGVEVLVVSSVVFEVVVLDVVVEAEDGRDDATVWVQV